ncbi:hypothetical protein Taro_016291 [Colocasia esculenta]|uniref:Protein kish n=1 Tax=Colocasia esculenta TaxID=4460 RepID=A0A843UJY7_COLES|nr:hypothetical protein [Colocasia esculenta]
MSQSALFNFHSFLTVVLLLICTCAYIKMQFPTILEQRTGLEISLEHAAVMYQQKSRKHTNAEICNA